MPCDGNAFLHATMQPVGRELPEKSLAARKAGRISLPSLSIDSGVGTPYIATYQSADGDAPQHTTWRTPVPHALSRKELHRHGDCQEAGPEAQRESPCGEEAHGQEEIAAGTVPSPREASLPWARSPHETDTCLEASCRRWLTRDENL
jgi:hypothetical protein